MSSIPWIIISIGATVVLLAVILIILFSKKKIPKREPDYYTWFIIGIVWLCAGVPLGINTNNWGLSAMGFIFMIFGLVHKKDWKKNHVKYKDLKPAEKKLKMWIMIALGIILLAGVVAFMIFG